MTKIEQVNVPEILDSLCSKLSHFTSENKIRSPALIGIRRGGTWIGRRISAKCFPSLDFGELNIAYYRDDTGRLMYMDVSYTDPDSPVMDFIRTMVNELVDPNEPQESKLENIGDAIGKGVLKFLDPFVSEALVTEAIITSIIRDGVDSETSQRIPGWKIEEDWTSAANIEAL